MRVLLIGSGGREHALAWAISRSPLLSRFYAAPGNPGIAEVAECVALDVTRNDDVVAFCRHEVIDLVVVGPEGPLVAGLVDDLDAAGVRAFGPNRAAAQLEGSKGFTKDLCRDARIPTAAYARFTDREAALADLEGRGAPIVVKADGLAAGKGVTVAMDVPTARAAIEAIFADPAGAALVLEDYMEGEEASYFALSDGETVIPFGTAQDHKRAYDGDTGPNTGGMGAVSPAAVVDDAMASRVMAEIIAPTVAALKARGIPYRGVLYAGLMLTAEGPKLIEYNARFGDPECQALMPRLQDDLLAILDAAARGRLADTRPRWSRDTAVTVVMAATGYPGSYRKGTPIRGVDTAAALPGVQVFHAGTCRDGAALLAEGGRVLGVTAIGTTAAEAQRRAYQAVALIDWPEGFCRSDIGRRAIEREEGGGQGTATP